MLKIILLIILSSRYLGYLSLIKSILAWKIKPELFVRNSYRAKPKNGWMLSLNSSYQINKDFDLLMRTGYKTKGFISGQPIHKTVIISLGGEYRI